ncbi:MAG: hypothetical protein LBU73_04535 [Helicobacteraceae bacterium]|jgi:antitoxin component of MazEF toxin-antitoxin module|nr:hypothetical protein [Helicobacteraceae bacterium]
MRHYKVNNKTKIINATNVEIDLDNDGLYSILFKYKNEYFTLCRNLDEEDEQIYIENNDQGNAVYVNPERINYVLQNGEIEFDIDKEVKFDMDFANKYIIKFSPVNTKQYNDIKEALENIFRANPS